MLNFGALDGVRPVMGVGCVGFHVDKTTFGTHILTVSMRAGIDQQKFSHLESYDRFLQPLLPPFSDFKPVT